MGPNIWAQVYRLLMERGEAYFYTFEAFVRIYDT